MKNNPVLFFSFQLLLILAVAFVVHASIQSAIGIGTFDKHIIITYSFNYLLAVVFFAVLLFFKKKKSTQLGFIFMFSSMLKFVLFFILLSPLLRTEQGVKSAEFISFFIPYGISSTFEVLCMVRILNK